MPHHLAGGFSSRSFLLGSGKLVCVMCVESVKLLSCMLYVSSFFLALGLSSFLSDTAPLSLSRLLWRQHIFTSLSPSLSLRRIHLLVFRLLRRGLCVLFHSPNSSLVALTLQSGLVLVGTPLLTK